MKFKLLDTFISVVAVVKESCGTEKIKNRFNRTCSDYGPRWTKKLSKFQFDSKMEKLMISCLHRSEWDVLLRSYLALRTASLSVQSQVKILLEKLQTPYQPSLDEHVAFILKNSETNLTLEIIWKSLFSSKVAQRKTWTRSEWALADLVVVTSCFILLFCVQRRISEENLYLIWDELRCGPVVTPADVNMEKKLYFV